MLELSGDVADGEGEELGAAVMGLNVSDKIARWPDSA